MSSSSNTHYYSHHDKNLFNIKGGTLRGGEKVLTFPAGNREGAGTLVVEIGVFPKEFALWQSAINLQFEESQREDCPRPSLASSSAWGGEDTSLMQVGSLGRHSFTVSTDE